MDRTGNIFVGTSSGIGQVNADGELVVYENGELDNLFIQKIQFDLKGNLWTVSNDERAFVVKVNGEVLSISPQLLGRLKATNVFVMKNGRIFLGTSKNKIAELEQVGEKFKSVLWETEGQQYINQIYEDNEGQIWVTSNTGFGYFDVSRRYHTAGDSLFSGSIGSVYQDYEGTYWVTSAREGLLKLSKSKFFQINTQANLAKEVFNATEKLNGEIYLGMDKGLIIILDKQYRQVNNRLTRMLDEIRIRSLYVDSRGSM